MRTILKSVPLIVSAALLLQACGERQAEEAPAAKVEPAAEATEQSQEARLLAFFARTNREDLERSPERQSYRGIKTDYDKWSDGSEAETDRVMGIIRARLAELQSFDFDALSPRLQLSYRLYKAQLDRTIERDAFRHHGYVVHHSSGPHTSIPAFLINIHRISDISDAEAYVSRLEKVPGPIDDTIAQLRIREDKGIFAPDWAWPKAIEAAQNVLTGMPFDKSNKDTALLADLKDKLSKIEATDADKAAVIERADTALRDIFAPAYAKLIAEYESQAELAPSKDGIWKVEGGDDYYAMRLRHYTTTDLTPQEIHQLGLDNVARIHEEMRSIMDKVGFKGTLQEFFLFMRNDPQFYMPDTDEGREAYLDHATKLITEMRTRLPEVFGILPKADIQVKRVEPFREKSAGKAFYQRPADDGSRPGTFYANLYNMKMMPLYQAAALAYHEGVPGHHMQRAIQNEFEDVPDFQRHSRFTAYTEGWGLYSEYLPKEMGFYQDPYEDFGRLSMELWRACRLVVDTGLHHKRWTREEAIQYQVDNTPNSEFDSMKAIERYTNSPGQATAYLIGKIKILELREEAKAELGDKFDIRGFHDEVLKDGPVPLTILEEKIDRWVSEVKAG